MITEAQKNGAGVVTYVCPWCEAQACCPESCCRSWHHANAMGKLDLVRGHVSPHEAKINEGSVL